MSHAEVSSEESARTRAAIERLRGELGLPEDFAPLLPILPMVLVAWSDGRLQPGEVELIRKIGRERRLGEAWAVIERLLGADPGPFFRHRLLHFLQALRLDQKLDDATAAAAAALALETAQAAGGLLGIGSVSQDERAELERVERALTAKVDALRTRLEARSSLPIVPEWLEPDARPRLSVHVDSGHDQLVQVIALHLGVASTPDRPWTPVLVAMEGLQARAELDPNEVREALLRTAHLPEGERWIVLRSMISALARPIDDLYHEELVAAARQSCALGEGFFLVDQLELASTFDELARSAGWVAWFPGKVEELLIDRDVVRRRVAPGTFDAPRAEVVARSEASAAPPEIPGLRFKRMVLQAEGREPLRLASPELPDALTPEAVAWIARFLPVVRDPFSTLLLDILPGGDARWSIDLRSSLLDAPSERPEPLPPGRSLVVPPWIWRRVALAF